MAKHLCILNIRDRKITNPKAIKTLVESLRDGKWKVEISTLDTRSLDQNAYYWMMLSEYVQPGLYNAGWSDVKTKEDAHFFVGNLFLKVKMINEQTGDVMERIRSTTDLSKMEMNAYWEEIWQWAAEYLGITIPAPNEQFTLYE
jgi:hypothetical protein